MDGLAGTTHAGRREGSWLGDDPFEAVAEVNLQCVELLAAMAAEREDPSGLFGGHIGWHSMSHESRARLASGPCLLVDAGFDDDHYWAAVGSRKAEGLSSRHAQPAFTGPGANDFVRRVFMLAWHMARANRQLARLVLGMSASTARHVARLKLRDLDWLAAHQSGRVRPRWEQQPRTWRHLVRASRLSDYTQGLNPVDLGGLQLMAARLVHGPLPVDRMRQVSLGQALRC